MARGCKAAAIFDAFPVAARKSGAIRMLHCEMHAAREFAIRSRIGAVSEAN